MWLKIIEHLNDPLLVVKVQNFFGVIYKRNCQSEATSTIHSGRYDREDEYDVRQHKRIPSDTSGSSLSSSTTDSSEGQEEVECHINNKFWYYLFVIGTALGDEIFYATFIPFWFWNIDGAVGRRVVLVWAIVMYIGQGMKDVVRWPRPGYPVRKLQQKWAIEYGMPSTHAMVAVSIPFSVLLYTMDRYQYPAHWGLIIAVSWCSLICVSRVYLGMHSVLDVAAGLLLSTLLLVPLIPAVDVLDGVLLQARWSPVAVILLSVLAIVLHPQSDKWTPTRGDTTMIVSVCAGLLVGAWVNYQCGNMAAAPSPPPYAVEWPGVDMAGCALLRTTLGLCGVLATRAGAEAVCYALLGRRRDAAGVDCCYKYFTYGLIGFNTTYVFPNVFALLLIDRPTYYTEI